MKIYRQSKSKYWWFDHTFPNGSRIRQSTKQTDKTIARIRALDEINQYEQQQKIIFAKGSFFTEYLAWARPRKKPKVVTNEIYIWKTFCAHCNTDNPLFVPVKTIDSFVTTMLGQRYSAATVNLYIRTLRMIFNRARRWKYIAANPFDEIEFMRFEPAPPRYLSQDEMNKFFLWTKKLHPELLPLFEFAFLTGMRRGEIFNLQWSDIDWQRKLITVKNTKAKRPRFVPLTPIAHDILHERKEDPAPFNRVLDRKLSAGFRPMQRICQRAEIPPVTLHDLRRTFATYLAESLSEKLLQQVLGHSNYSVTDIFYIGDNADAIRQKMIALDDKLRAALNFTGMTQVIGMT